MFRWVLIIAVVVGLVWLARNVPIDGRTVWDRLSGKIEHVADVAEGVEKRLGSQDVTERLRGEEREELRRIVRERASGQ